MFREALLFTVATSLTACTPATKPQAVQVLESRVNIVTSLPAARIALDSAMNAREPAIYVLSAKWCTYCKPLEEDLKHFANGSRRVIVAQLDDPNPLIRYANRYAKHDNVTGFGREIPNSIIIAFDGQNVWATGYSPETNEFPNNSLGRSISMDELF